MASSIFSGHAALYSEYYSGEQFALNRPVTGEDPDLDCCGDKRPPNALVATLDGAARTTGVVVVGAANQPTMIDPALLRPGSLSPHMKISPPDVTMRMVVLLHHPGARTSALSS